MDRKGQVGIAALITIFVAIIIGTTLIVPSASNVATTTNTRNLVNGTYTVGAVNVTIDLVGQELLSTPVVVNASNSSMLVAAGNYTIAETISATDGLKGITYKTLDNSIYASRGVNISYDYGADGYIESAGGRSVAGLVIIFAALAIAAAAITKLIYDGKIITG